MHFTNKKDILPFSYLNLKIKRDRGEGRGGEEFKHWLVSKALIRVQVSSK